LDQRVLYIIGKLLERRCLNGFAWSIWTLETQVMTKRRVGIKLLLKVENWPDFFSCRWHATYCWKAFDESYNFSWDLISIEGLHTKLSAPKIMGIPTLGILKLPLGSLETKWHLGVDFVAMHRVYYEGEGDGFPQFGPWWIL